MSVQDYKQSIKEIIDATDNKLLQKHWKEQLEYDVKHKSEIEISEDEWNLVQEGITEYNCKGMTFDS